MTGYPVSGCTVVDKRLLDSCGAGEAVRLVQGHEGSGCSAIIIKIKDGRVEVYSEEAYHHMPK